MFTGTYRLKSDKWYLHRQQQTQNIEDGIAGEQTHGIPTHQQQCKHMQRYQIDYENITTPRGNLKYRKHQYTMQNYERIK